MSGPVHGEARADDARSSVEPTKRPSSPAGADYLLALQRSVGNQAVAGLLDAADTSTAPVQRHTKSAVVQRDDGPSTNSEKYGAAQPGDRPGTGGGPGFGTGMDATRTIGNGTFRYSLRPQVGLVHARIEFTPTPAIAAAAKTIAFVQTVQEAMSSTSFWRGKESSTGTNEVDRGAADRDPFYGAQWDPSGKWGGEPNSTQARPEDLNGAPRTPREGSSPVGSGAKSAILNDSPMLKVGESKQFETAAIIVETGQLLGSFTWTIQRIVAGFFGNDSSTLIRSAGVREAPTPEFQKALDDYYSAKASLRGFALGSADLPPGYEATLAKVLDGLQKAPNMSVTLGGAATKEEPDPPALSRRRAEAVGAYLTSKGIAGQRIKIEAHGSDWARAPLSSPDAGQVNRRVEINVG